MKNSLDKFVSAYEGEIQYDFDNKILLNWYPKRILNFAQGAESILELGLGHGYTTNIFSKYFKKHIVLDGSHAVIENFNKKFPDCKAQIVQSYFEEFNTTEKFDVIVMGFILEHVDDPNLILTLYKKFLAPGGKMFLAVPNAESLNRRLGNIMGLLPNMLQLSKNDEILGHQRFYTVNSFTEEIKKAGYSIERLEGIYLKPFTTSQLQSMHLDDTAFDALCTVGVNYPELSCGLLAQVKAIS
jgi:2-polyprenyl-3-methyl-5-hydroxy-6-metoxy-1,4-benzoquinol methylase